MSLSTDLISQFAKVINDKKETKTDTITYGTLFKEGDKYYVQLDGFSYDERLPVSSSQLSSSVVTNKKTNSARVVVMIKNHMATVISGLEADGAEITTLDNVSISIEDIKDLKTDNTTIKNTLTAQNADIKSLTADNIEIKDTLSVTTVKVANLVANFISAYDVKSKYATIESLDATNAKIYNLDAVYAEIEDLDVTSLAAVYGKIENLFAKSGLIENVTVSDGTITGMLVGVTIKGDLIEGNTIVADKLVIKGEDGLYYKLNTDGVTTEGEQTEYNSLNGSIITAKSITASQVSVDDLVAFDATIGGFSITDDSIHSEVKDSEGNTIRGIYMDTDGQFNFGDASNFVKYYKDDSGNYKLAISAASILYALNGKQYSIEDLGKIGEYVHVSTYEDEPCIELGESDSDFKLIITNTRIMFMDGPTVPAYINNQSLHITKAVIEEEIQQGEFVWKVRSNGNMGLMWKGGV